MISKVFGFRKKFSLVSSTCSILWLILALDLVAGENAATKWPWDEKEFQDQIKKVLWLLIIVFVFAVIGLCAIISVCIWACCKCIIGGEPQMQGKHFEIQA